MWYAHLQLLSLVVPVLHRLEWCCTTIGSGGANSLLEHHVSECLQFLPNETAGKIKGHALFGVITTQTISYQHCTLDVNSKSMSPISFICCLMVGPKFDIGMILK
jgi:hypothetical protein